MELEKFFIDHLLFCLRPWAGWRHRGCRCGCWQIAAWVLPGCPSSSRFRSPGSGRPRPMSWAPRLTTLILSVFFAGCGPRFMKPPTVPLIVPFMGCLKRTLATPPGPSVAMCIPCVPGQVPPIAEDCSAEHATVLHSARSFHRPDESEHLT